MRFVFATALILALPAASLVPAVALASPARFLSIHELTATADAVVVGQAVSKESFWSEGRILTRVKVTLDEVWSGSATRGATLDVVTLGGVVGDLGQRVDGAAVVPMGTKLVLFLRRGERVEGYVPNGMWQGVFAIEPTQALLSIDPPVARLYGEEHLVTPQRAQVDLLPRRLSELRRAVVSAAATNPSRVNP